ncbi:delta()-delta()-dienoyl- [Lynx pardinus]|uniref:Delta( )-delta( )-dienoyl n=1 Tax=Lynx pardinus TaxID=191816 RepID=A0A485PSG7_LYNPA|nr:delta()-delta()-dienoyl- [Lynx pardinus]
MAVSLRFRDLLIRRESPRPLGVPSSVVLSLGSLLPMLKEAPDHSYESLRVTAAQKHILHVQLNRPEKRNAINRACWREMVECFSKIAQDPDCRAVVISGAGKLFTSERHAQNATGGRAEREGDTIQNRLQAVRTELNTGLEPMTQSAPCCRAVVYILSTHTTRAVVIGGQVRNILRICNICIYAYVIYVYTHIQEVDIGLAADVGTLQRLPKVIGNQSLVNELAFTSRKMMADEALGSGLVSRVFPNKEDMLEAAFTLAEEISTKSPVAVQSTKVNLIYSRNHSVAESLNYMATWNMSMLQTQDIVKSVQATLEKKDLKSVNFSKL